MSRRRDGTPIDHAALPARRRGRGAGIGLNLTAMIDVTFLLLVYFLVATEFKLGEEIYRLDLPDRNAGAPADPFTLDEEPLRIEVRSIGFGLGSYDLRLDGPYDKPTSFDALYRFLAGTQITAANPTGLFGPDHPLVIEPSSTTRWEHAIEAFNSAARARYTNITLGEGQRGRGVEG